MTLIIITAKRPPSQSSYTTDYWIYVDEPVMEAYARVPDAISRLEDIGATECKLKSIAQQDETYIHLPSPNTTA